MRVAMGATDVIEKPKFADPRVTARGEPRASVDYRGTRTLWFNTGTLCNIECANCYIESSPRNDALVFLGLDDIAPFLDELDAAGERTIEIGFTGGEPFMAPEILAMLEAALRRGHRVLVLTNAMQPMMRPRIKKGLQALLGEFGDQMTLRVSFDHYTAERHDHERGAGSFAIATQGLAWLAREGFQTTIAGRSMWDEGEASTRRGFSAFAKTMKLDIDAQNPAHLVLFPEMDADANPPEITTACWGILEKSPADVMCATQRMVVKRKGAMRATVTACTLLPYAPQFDLGPTLRAARKAVPLNHPYCASFCVLGGGSCSA